MNLIAIDSYEPPKGKLILGMYRSFNRDEFYLLRRVRDSYFDMQNRQVAITHWADIGINSPFICPTCAFRSYDRADINHKYCKGCKDFRRHIAIEEPAND